MENQRRETAKKEQIAAWVAEHGTENQQQRFAANLFPIAEAVEAIKAATFADLDAKYSPYQPLQSADCPCECENAYEPCGIEFESNTAETVTEAEWNQMSAMKKVLNAEFAVKIHVAERDDCDEKTTRKGVFAKVLVGGFTFNREYAII
jgi:hypothetical protein